MINETSHSNGINRFMRMMYILNKYQITAGWYILQCVVAKMQFIPKIQWIKAAYCRCLKLLKTLLFDLWNVSRMCKSLGNNENARNCQVYDTHRYLIRLMKLNFIFNISVDLFRFFIRFKEKRMTLYRSQNWCWSWFKISCCCCYALA